MKSRFVIGEAFSSLGRNLTMTIAMIITTAVSLALLASGILVTELTERTKAMYLERVEVQIELNEEISATDATCASAACAAVVQRLEGTAGVASVTYRNRQQNFDHFVNIFKDTDPELVANATPEALPAVVLVRLDDPTDVSPLAGIEELPQVVYVADQKEEVGNAAQNLDSVRNATFLIAAVQAIAAIFLIANMVQIAAYSRRKEVDIMRMVGASRWFTQAPFVLEAVIASFIGGLAAVGALFAGKAAVIDPAMESLYKAQLVAPVTNADIAVVAPIVVLIGMVFAGIVAQITLRFYSKN